MLSYLMPAASIENRHHNVKLPGGTMLHMVSICFQRASLGSVAILLFSVDANALITQKVKNACKNDYFTYCSQHAVGSSALRTCMRGAQDSLSKTCLNALVDDGEVSKEDIHRYKRRHHR